MSIMDEHFMMEALKEAGKASEKGEVPVGAVVVYSGVIIARGHNEKESLRDPTAHAEITTIRQAADSIGSWRLNDATIYVSLEPCVMCMGAILQARVSRLVFGCLDPKAGACGSLYDLSSDNRLNHRVEVTHGILAEETSRQLKQFFIALRGWKNESAKGES